MTTTFADWLVNEIRVRGMTQAELARKSGVSTGGISDVLSGRREPGSTIARKIAKGLDIPEEDVFKAAGLLEGRVEHSREVDQIMTLVDQMAADEQKELLSYIRWKNNQNKK